MRILVTGAAGFIGSHLSERLIASGAHVTGVDNFDPFYDKSIKIRNLSELQKQTRFSLVEADIRDANAMKNLFEEKFDAIFHLAALAGVRPSIQNPQRYYDVNLLGTLNLLNSIKASNQKPAFLFGSSSSVYGGMAEIPFHEEMKVDRPYSPYAATKAAGELMCFHSYHLDQLPTACFRFFTVFGPRQRPDLMINKFCRAISCDEAIPVFGDGTTSRDYTFVADIVDGLTGALRWILEKPQPFEIFNLGHNHPVKLNEAIQTIETEIGKKAKIKRFSEQPGDVPKTYASIEKAKRTFGYEPKVSFQEGIREYVAWMKDLPS